jgi:hypothetical protein
MKTLKTSNVQWKMAMAMVGATGGVRRKSRSDSPLRTLPPETQAEIVEWMKTLALREISRRLAEAGIRVLPPALSKFRRWYLEGADAQMRRAEALVDQLEALKQAIRGDGGTKLGADDLFRLAYQMMIARALKQGDTAALARLHRMWTDGRRLELQQPTAALLTGRIARQAPSDQNPPPESAPSSGPGTGTQPPPQAPKTPNAGQAGSIP